LRSVLGIREIEHVKDHKSFAIVDQALG